MVSDVYSRKVVAWQVHLSEDSEHAAALIRQACLDEGVEPEQLVLHSDNGAPMKGITLLAMLQALGVTPSFSRPRVSNDNPYSESLFRTVKYRPWYPQRPFSSVLEARECVETFVHWYNDEHRHRAIRLRIPVQLDHRIRRKPITDSDSTRSLIPAEADHRFRCQADHFSAMTGIDHGVRGEGARGAG